MKKGLRNYAIRSDTNAERRHISEMAAIILAHTGCSVVEAVHDAFRIADTVDARITQEIEEINADLERERAEIERRIKERQKGESDGDKKQTTEDTEDIPSKFGPDRLPGYLDK